MYFETQIITLLKQQKLFDFCYRLLPYNFTLQVQYVLAVNCRSPWFTTMTDVHLQLNQLLDVKPLHHRLEVCSQNLYSFNNNSQISKVPRVVTSAHLLMNKSLHFTKFKPYMYHMVNVRTLFYGWPWLSSSRSFYTSVINAPTYWC